MTFQLSDTLWPPQRKCLEDVLYELQEGCDWLCLYSPTGSGKSVMAMELFRWVQSLGLGGNFYVNRKLLIGQTHRHMVNAGIEAGIRAAEYDDMYYEDLDFQITSAPTEASRVFKSGRWDLHHVGEGGLVVIDESHLQRSKVIRDIIRLYRNQGARIVLLTATPVAMKGWCEKLIVAGKLSEWRECGALVAVEPTTVSQPDLKKVKRNATGEFVIDGKKRRLFTQHIVGDVIEHYEQLNQEVNGAPAFMYAPCVDSSRWLVRQFRERGHRFIHVDATSATIDGEKYTITRDVWQDILGQVADGTCKGISSRFKCLDMETEVLTREGWKGYGEVSISDEVATMRMDGAVSWEQPSRIVEGTHAGKWCELKNASVDIMVTDDHDLIVRNPKCRWKKESAQYAARRSANFQIPVAATDMVSDIPLSDAALQVIGWMMTDGHILPYGAWSITQSMVNAETTHGHIRSCLEGAGLKWTERDYVGTCSGKKYPFRRFNMKVEQVRACSFAQYVSKDFHPYLLDMSRRQLGVMLESINLADGSKYQNVSWDPKTYEISKGNRTFLSRLQALCVVRGMRANIHYSQDKCPRIYITPNRTHATVRWGLEDTDGYDRLRIKMVDRCSRKWCLTVPTGTLIIRRNGKVAVVGNCREGIDIPAASHCIFATPIGSLASYLQAIGRVMRSHAESGKTKAILQCHGGNYHRHGSPNLDRPWQDLWQLREHAASSLHMDRMREREELEPIRCPKCGAERRSGAKCWKCGYEAPQGERRVMQEDGTIRKVKGELIRKPRRQTRPNTERLWTNMFYGYRKKKVNQSFLQMEAFFFREHGYKPERNLPFMPRRTIDWYAKVHEVPMEALTGRHKEKFTEKLGD